MQSHQFTSSAYNCVEYHALMNEHAISNVAVSQSWGTAEKRQLFSASRFVVIYGSIYQKEQRPVKVKAGSPMYGSTGYNILKMRSQMPNDKKSLLNKDEFTNA